MNGCTKLKIDKLEKISTIPSADNKSTFIANKTKGNHINLKGLNSDSVINDVILFAKKYDIWSFNDIIQSTIRPVSYSASKSHDISFIITFYNQMVNVLNKKINSSDKSIESNNSTQVPIIPDSRFAPVSFLKKEMHQPVILQNNMDLLTQPYKPVVFQNVIQPIQTPVMVQENNPNRKQIEVRNLTNKNIKNNEVLKTQLDDSMNFNSDCSEINELLNNRLKEKTNKQVKLDFTELSKQKKSKISTNAKPTKTIEITTKKLSEDNFESAINPESDSELSINNTNDSYNLDSDSNIDSDSDNDSDNDSNNDSDNDSNTSASVISPNLSESQVSTESSTKSYVTVDSLSYNNSSDVENPRVASVSFLKKKKTIQPKVTLVQGKKKGTKTLSNKSPIKITKQYTKKEPEKNREIIAKITKENPKKNTKQVKSLKIDLDKKNKVIAKTRIDINKTQKKSKKK